MLDKLVSAWASMLSLQAQKPRCSKRPLYRKGARMSQLLHERAKTIYGAYVRAYHGEIQGCCPVIADDIINQIGGVPVAGYLILGGTTRTHWWVDMDGVVLDPMGDDYLSYETYGARQEEHRDRSIFDAILPHYEQWRVCHG